MLELACDLEREEGRTRLFTALDPNGERAGARVDRLVHAARPPGHLAEHLELIGIRELGVVHLA